MKIKLKYWIMNLIIEKVQFIISKINIDLNFNSLNFQDINFENSSSINNSIKNENINENELANNSLDKNCTSLCIFIKLKISNSME